MNILAIDFGTKKIGLAWTQSDIGVVLPYGLIYEKPNSSRLDQLVNLITEEKIDELVVGLPINVDLEKQENMNTKRVRDFIKQLNCRIDIPVTFIDERFSSAEADEMGGEATRDEKSAMVILQSYFKDQK